MEYGVGEVDTLLAKMLAPPTEHVQVEALQDVGSPAGSKPTLTVLGFTTMPTVGVDAVVVDAFVMLPAATLAN